MSKMICSIYKKMIAEEIAKAVNLSPGLMHNKGSGQGPPLVLVVKPKYQIS